MNPADVRALIAVLLRGQDLEMIINKGFFKTSLMTDDFYLAQAQEILESSWNPLNYKHPAGMDNSQLGVAEAIAVLEKSGYRGYFNNSSALADALKPQQLEAASPPPSST